MCCLIRAIANFQGAMIREWSNNGTMINRENVKKNRRNNFWSSISSTTKVTLNYPVLNPGLRYGVVFYVG
jgi:hypothetical protein